MSVTVVDAIARIRPDFGNTLGSMSLIERGFALAIPLALAGTAAALIHTGVEAQSQLNIVQALTHTSAAQMDAYTTALEGMGAKMGFTLAESAKGLYYVVSAGFQGKDALELVRLSMEHAAAAGAPLKDVTNGLTSALNAYHASIKDATKYSDIFTLAVTYGKQTTEDFANNVSKAALMAASAHVPFIQLAAAEAALTEKGESSSRAFTELSFMMSKISVPSADQMAKSVAALGGHLDTTKYAGADLMGKLSLLRNETTLSEDSFLKLVGGTRSARGALGLLADGGQAYYDILKKMETQTGATADAFKTHTHTMAFAFDQVKAALSNAGYELVKMITPGAIDFLGHLADAAGKLPDLFHTIGGFAGTIGSAFAPLGDTITHVDGPMKTFGKHIGETSTIVSVHKGVLSQAGDMARQFGGWVREHMTGVLQFLQPTIANVTKTVGQFASDLGNKLRPALANIGWALRFLELLWDSAWPAMSAVLTGVWDIIKGVVQIAWSIVSGIIKVGLDLLGGNWKAAWTDLGDMLKGIWDGINKILDGALKIMAGAVLAAVSAILGLLAKIPGPIGDAARTALKGVQDLAAQMQQAGEDAGTSFAAGLSYSAGAVQAAAAALHNAAFVGASGGSGGRMRAYASGTDDAPGGLAIVHTGEMFLPPHSRIIPAAQTAALLGGSGGGGGGAMEIHVHPHISIDGRELTTRVVEHIPAVVRLGTGLKR